jgi:hypothetical protein
MRLGVESPKITEAKIIKALETVPDVPRRFFTSFETSVIRKYVPLKGIPSVAKILGRSIVQVTNKWYKVKKELNERCVQRDRVDRLGR